MCKILYTTQSGKLRKASATSRALLWTRGSKKTLDGSCFSNPLFRAKHVKTPCFGAEHLTNFLPIDQNIFLALVDNDKLHRKDKSMSSSFTELSGMQCQILEPLMPPPPLVWKYGRKYTAWRKVLNSIQ